MINHNFDLRSTKLISHHKNRNKSNEKTSKKNTDNKNK